MGNYTIFWMFENPRRGRQPRNFTTNVPKILDLKSSFEQTLTLGAPDKVRCLGTKLSPALFFRKKVLFWIKYSQLSIYTRGNFCCIRKCFGLVTSKMFGFAGRVNTYQLIREHSFRDSGTKYSILDARFLARD